MDNENKENKKEIEIVSGNAEDLNFSEVHEYMKTLTKSNEEKNEKKEIVIPKGSSDKK